MYLSLFAAALAAPEAAPESTEPIVVTASREPVAEDEAPVSATVFAGETLERLLDPDAAEILRLSPGISVATSGPRGTLTQVRIRGAEANHTLLFVDGIRFNDPAAGNEARFELLGTDLLSRIEVVRGPQSALWGSEALGGVIAVETPDPFGAPSLAALAEYGGQDSRRAAAQLAVRTGDLGLSASGAWMDSNGVDSFDGGPLERDGFESRSASLRAVYRPTDAGEIGVSAFYVGGTSEYDGLPAPLYQRADTFDETRNRIFAVRGWGSAEWQGWSLRLDGSLLDSANRNRLGDDPLNSTFGRRFTAGGQVSRSWGRHRFTAAAEHEGEDFRARDQVYFGGTDQDRSRDLTALVGEWHAVWTDAIVTDIAVRHDSFSAFEDATTVRAAVIVRPVDGISLHAAYGEGIAQPTFYDLYGFFPGSFVGNPSLTPEQSRGWEAGVRFSRGPAAFSATLFDNRLTNEIVDFFDPVGGGFSTRNADGKSRRRGVELSADYRFSDALTLGANYTFLDAEERTNPAADRTREVRRPRHSANLIATGSAGRLNWGGSLSYVGVRSDFDNDLFPAPRMRLDDYVLASLRLGYQVTPELEAYARVENGLDAEYEDVFGYNTPGRSLHAGLRLRLGR